MKKKYYVSMLLIGFYSASLQAQSLKITGGPLLETNLSNFIHSGVDNSQSKMKFGFGTGGFLNLGISKSFSIQGEMLFRYKSSDFSWDSQTGHYQYWGMEIPVYAMYHFTFTKGDRFTIGIGPYTDFGLGASFKEGGRKLDVYEKNEQTGLPAMVDSDTGFGIKIGYEFVSGFQINVTHKASVTNVIDANSSKTKMYPQTLSLGIAYRFGK